MLALSLPNVLEEGLAPPESFRTRGLQPRAIAALPPQLEPTEGFEPTTFALQKRCSTTELCRRESILPEEYSEDKCNKE